MTALDCFILTAAVIGVFGGLVTVIGAIQRLPESRRRNLYADWLREVHELNPDYKTIRHADGSAPSISGPMSVESFGQRGPREADEPVSPVSISIHYQDQDAGQYREVSFQNVEDESIVYSGLLNAQERWALAQRLREVAEQLEEGVVDRPNKQTREVAA